MLCDRTLEEGRIAGAVSLGADLVRRAAKALAGAQPAEEDLGTFRLDTFTQERVAGLAAPVDAVEPPQPPRRVPWVLIALALMLVVFGATMAVTYASDLVNTTAIPDAPAAPKRDPPPLPALTPPTDADIAAWGKGRA